MKLSKSLQYLFDNADYLVIVPTSVRASTCWVDRFTVRAYSIYGDYATITSQSWKTESGAYRAACRLRPDLLDTFDGIRYADCF